MVGRIEVESQIGRKWDRCFTDLILKTGGGLLLGSVFSILFFKRRMWPVVLGTGAGMGIAYSNCERDLNSTFLSACAPQQPPKSESKPK